MATIGEQFAEALAGKDYARITGLLGQDVDFRALTPNRTWQATGPDAVISEILTSWFEDSDHIDELVEVEAGEMADRQKVSYRFRGHNDDGPFLVEQEAYLATEDGRIVWMRVLCSGFRPA